MALHALVNLPLCLGCEGCESCTKNMKWTPIIDCREELQLALTPVVEGKT